MRYIFMGLFIATLFIGARYIPLYAQEQLQTEGSEETEQLPVLTDKPLEIWTFIDDYRVITGKILHVTVQVIWKLGVTVNLENIDTIDLHPFTIESVTVGERQIFDNEHDYIVITYALSLPPDLENGIYSIPPFSLSYRNEVDKTEGESLSSPIAIQKTPIIVEGKVDRDVITLGDQITYTLTIRHEKEVKLLWENIKNINFSPFEILEKNIDTQTKGNIERAVINYTLSLYELGGKKKTPEIPGVPILYYEEPNPQHAAKTNTTTIETKETRTTPVPIVLNSLLKTVDVPLEGMKGPFYISKKQVFFRGYLPIGFGVVLLLFLGGMTAWSRAKRLSTRRIPKPELETPQLALQRLKNTLASFQFTREDAADRKNIHAIDKAFRTYLGTLIGISGEYAQSVTTSEFLNYDTEKKLSEETSHIIQTVLKQLDVLIFGEHVDKETVNTMIQGTEEVIRQTESGILAKSV
ncbi:MAG: hypothetical protein E3K32_08235 [wastewater metagenome]|nr:hypothetical protein [Candidatus Loosdrechtia aerotolerans]